MLQPVRWSQRNATDPMTTMDPYSLVLHRHRSHESDKYPGRCHRPPSCSDEAIPFFRNLWACVIIHRFVRFPSMPRDRRRPFASHDAALRVRNRTRHCYLVVIAFLPPLFLVDAPSRTRRLSSSGGIGDRSCHPPPLLLLLVVVFFHRGGPPSSSAS